MEVCDKLMVSSPDFAKKVDHIRDTFQLFNNLEAQKKIDTYSERFDSK